MLKKTLSAGRKKGSVTESDVANAAKDPNQKKYFNTSVCWAWRVNNGTCK